MVSLSNHERIEILSIPRQARDERKESAINVTPITFGTSGWRALLADEFTFENAKVVVRAIADEILSGGTGEGGVIVSHDTRFLGEEFAVMAARVLTGAGLTAHLTNRNAPTPVVAFEIIRRGCAGGINFTASHNPSGYQGIKFSPSNGGPATKELTKSLERRILDIQLSGTTIPLTPLGEIPKDRIDPKEPYKKRIASIVNMDAIKKSGLKILCNCLYGTSSGYLDALLTEAGCNVTVMNNHPDPRFGGFPPEPDPKYVGDFTARLAREGFDLGLATDGDADRFGVFGLDNSKDAKNPICIAPNANEMLALLLEHLVTSRNWKGTVVRTVATSHFVDAVAARHGCKIIEVPVGFKWIAGEMEKDPAGFVIGGEESGGLTIRGHVPEKDGILACLLVAEMVALKKRSLADLLDDLKNQTGRIASSRINIAYDAANKKSLLEKVSQATSGSGMTIAGRRVVKNNNLDGAKFILEDGSWIMTRFSGTEPVIRLYVEGREGTLAELERAGRELLGQI